MNTDYQLALWVADAHLLSYLSHKGEKRSRERIAALYSVYTTVRYRIRELNNEFRPYIDRLTNAVQKGLSIRTAFPPEAIKEAFCAPALNWHETDVVFWGLPDTMSYALPSQRLRLLSLEGKELHSLMSEVASKSKSQALSRFYDAFLAFFVERIELAFNSDGVTVWSCIDDEQAFSLAIDAGLTAVEYPEVAKFGPSLW